MSRWEIKVYAFNQGHIYTMYSNATLESAKANMMRRFREHSAHGQNIAEIVIRDLKEECLVHVRKINGLGNPKTRWKKVNYSPTCFPDKNAWDKSNHDYFKSRLRYDRGHF